MNLDLLTKLVKLANNNPNEHEANSAARRVCKLIAEADFKFVSNEPVHPGWDRFEKAAETIRKAQANATRSASNPPSSKAADWFKRYYYDPPAPWSSRPEPPPYTKPDQPKEPPIYTEPPRYTVPDLDDLINNMFYGASPPSRTKSKPKDTVNRECTRCRKKVDTSNDKEIFVCSACEWDKFKIEHPEWYEHEKL